MAKKNKSPLATMLSSSAYIMLGAALTAVAGVITGEILFYLAAGLFAISGIGGVFVIGRFSRKFKDK